KGNGWTAEGHISDKRQKGGCPLRITTFGCCAGASAGVVFFLTRRKMRASSALVSFVRSEISKQVWYFARLFVPLQPLTYILDSSERYDKACSIVPVEG
ncbi:MAG: hypothetical protein UHS32_02195, partial [Bacteroidaceae bacterium]|nr:hypothetical protein [Bacteroidaceae bacterium]